MSSFEVDIDSARALLVLRNGGRKLAYALANTVNTTAREIQTDERRHLPHIFTVRNASFLNRMIAIIRFASVPQGRLEARVSVGQRKRLLLGQFEQGGVREPVRGNRTAIPLVGGARPSLGSPVPEALWVQRLGLHPVPGHGRRGPIEGLLGTFLIRTLGILQRLPGGRDRLLYLFKAGVRVPARLQWYYIAERVAALTAPRVLREQVDESFAHANLGTTFTRFSSSGLLA